MNASITSPIFINDRHGKDCGVLLEYGFIAMGDTITKKQWLDDHF